MRRQRQGGTQTAATRDVLRALALYRLLDREPDLQQAAPIPVASFKPGSCRCFNPDCWAIAHGIAETALS